MSVTFTPGVQDRVGLTTAVNAWEMIYDELSGVAMAAAGEIPGRFQGLNYMVAALAADATASDDQLKFRMARDVIADTAKQARAWIAGVAA